MTAERRAAWLWGAWAERLCLASLVLRGWRVLAHRWRPPRGCGAGEVDIIARRGRVLAFIEVKARPARQEALEALGPRQRARILRAAEVFVQARPRLAGLDMRFDVMVVRPWRPPLHLFDAWRPEGGAGKVGAG